MTRSHRLRVAASAALLIVNTCIAQTAGPESVLVVINANSSLSRSIGDYYVQRRSIPKANICTIRATDQEAIERHVYTKEIAQPIGDCLKSRKLVESVLYIVTTQGVPLKISGTNSPSGDYASVDSELTTLYATLHGTTVRLNGPAPNPFFRQPDATFRHPQFPLYLVTRLAAYDLAGVKALIDRSLQARNRGRVILDARINGSDKSGDEWLKNAAILLPADRVVLEETSKVLYGQTEVIGYGSWGSNDGNRKQRKLGFQWLPGAIATEYVSTNGRTFAKPPETWNLGTWSSPKSWFAGAPQTLTADLIAEGATAASGHVDEPYLSYTPRPDFLFPAYLSGRNLAESFYLAIPALSWQNIVIGDPLCSLR
jgi:uncharacterized protein (TIGR03790 family)